MSPVNSISLVIVTQVSRGFVVVVVVYGVLFTEVWHDVDSFLPLHFSSLFLFNPLLSSLLYF